MKDGKLDAAACIYVHDNQGVDRAITFADLAGAPLLEDPSQGADQPENRGLCG